MFTIGDFARHGRVSVRMLRHYDATGLLRPAHVDPSHRLPPLTRRPSSPGSTASSPSSDLGFTLCSRSRDPRTTRSAPSSCAPCCGCGGRTWRRTSRRRPPGSARSRRGSGPSRARGTCPPKTSSSSSCPRSASPNSPPSQRTSTPSGRSSSRCTRSCSGASAWPASSPRGGVARYEDAPDGGILVHAGVECRPRRATAATAGRGAGARPAAGRERAATLVHRGSMDAVLPSVQTLARWIDAHGHRSVGYPREINLECPEDRADWVTELQEPLA